MSAYVVDPTHIDALLGVAMHGPTNRAPQYPGDGWHKPYVADLIVGDENEAARLSVEGTERVLTLEVSTASEVGAVLLAECIESVSYRYPQDDRSSLPGPIPTPDPEQYEWTDLGRGRGLLTTFEALSALDGYEYQSCEHPGWRESSAKAFCDRLRSGLIHSLPGYRDAGGWHVSVEQAIERSGLTV